MKTETEISGVQGRSSAELGVRSAECGKQENANIEHPTSNAEHRIGDGREARTSTRTKNRNDDWLRQRSKVQGPRSKVGTERRARLDMVGGWVFSISMPKRQRVFPDWQCAVQDLAEILDVPSGFVVLHHFCPCPVRRWFFTDFQLFPLISTWFRSFDNKNNFFGDGQPCRPCGGVGRIPWNRLA